MERGVCNRMSHFFYGASKKSAAYRKSHPLLRLLRQVRAVTPPPLPDRSTATASGRRSRTPESTIQTAPATARTQNTVFIYIFQVCIYIIQDFIYIIQDLKYINKDLKLSRGRGTGSLRGLPRSREGFLPAAQHGEKARHPFYFFERNIWHFQKSAYLCTRKRETNEFASE